MAEPTTFLNAIREALWEEMERDPSVFLLGEDIANYGGAFKLTKGFIEHFGPDRVWDMPISEGIIVDSAVGASMNGLRPVAEIQFLDFITCCFDQICSYAAKQLYRWDVKCPIVIRGPYGAKTSGGPYHSACPEAWFANMPGVKLVAPAHVYDAKGLLKAAIRDDNPVIFMESKWLYRNLKEVIPPGDQVFTPLGKAAVRREGRHCTVVAWANMVHESYIAADKLAKEGVELEVIDLRTITPWDHETVLESVKKTGRCIVFHEAPRTGGFGGEIAAYIGQEGFAWLDAPVTRIGAPDTHVPFAKPLENYYVPNAEDLIGAVREVMAY
ncbi:MAG: 2-oxoisovalerate dehydrogenase subunit beta [Myxococcota bacterium]|nr:2-oxoisovalerate dehydrogenase subunit beta [Myxococcota bacterium]